MRRDALLALGLLAAGWALTLWVEPWSNERINDLGVYRVYAAEMLAGGLPYRDFFFEYPPLSAPLIALAGIPGTDYETFRASFALITLVIAALVVLLCAALAEWSGGARRPALLAAAAMPVLCGALLRTHFDLAPVAVTLAALWLLCIERPRLGLALLGVGALVKGFPLLVAPVALVWLWRRGRRRAAWQGALACAAVVAAVSGASLAVSPSGVSDTLRYHLERPLQVESAPAVALLALDRLGIGEADVRTSHGSEGIHHPSDELVGGLFLALLLGVLVLLVLARAPDAEEGSRRHLILASLTAVAAFASLGKVLSPQFLIWVYPLGALALAWRMHALAAAVAAATLLTLVEFPTYYFDYVRGEPAALVLVGVRDIALLLTLGLALRALQIRRHQDLLDRRRSAVFAGLD